MDVIVVFLVAFFGLMILAWLGGSGMTLGTIFVCAITFGVIFFCFVIPGLKPRQSPPPVDLGTFKFDPKIGNKGAPPANQVPPQDIQNIGPVTGDDIRRG